MKKFLFLIVIINLASVSNAALIWEVDSITLDIGETGVVHILSDDSYEYSVYMGNDPSPVAEITNVVSPYPSEIAVASIITPGWWSLMALTNQVPTGIHWEVSILGNSEGTYQLNSDYNEDTGPNDILKINVIPEPMTVWLLSLGCLLFLRKDRRQTQN